MKTACFFNYTGPGRISIARYAPRGISGFRRYAALAPTAPMLKMKYGPYRELYFRDILGPLDPQAVWDDLHALVAPHEPVLLCWERPPLSVTSSNGNWCHRTLLSEWFERELSLQVPEM